nr:orexin isoform X1 [Chrysemys picta bellii]
MGFGGQELTSCALAHGLPPWPHLGVRAQGGAGECSLEQGPGHGAGQGTAPGGRAPLPGFCWGDSGGRIESQSNRGLPGAARAEKPALSRAGFPHRQQKLGATPPRHVFRAGSKLRRYKEQTPSWCSGCCLSEGRGLAALPRWAAAAGSGELSKSGPSPSGAKLGLAWGTPGAQAVRAPPPPRREEDPRCSCGDRVMPGKEAAAGAAGGAASRCWDSACLGSRPRSLARSECQVLAPSAARGWGSCQLGGFAGDKPWPVALAICPQSSPALGVLPSSRRGDGEALVMDPQGMSLPPAQSSAGHSPSGLISHRARLQLGPLLPAAVHPPVPPLRRPLISRTPPAKAPCSPACGASSGLVEVGASRADLPAVSWGRARGALGLQGGPGPTRKLLPPALGGS